MISFRSCSGASARFVPAWAGAARTGRPGGSRCPRGNADRVREVSRFSTAGRSFARPDAGCVTADLADERSVDELNRRGIPAAGIHSLLTAEARVAAWRVARAGELRLLYVAPERFRQIVLRSCSRNCPCRASWWTRRIVCRSGATNFARTIGCCAMRRPVPPKRPAAWAAADGSFPPRLRPKS